MEVKEDLKVIKTEYGFTAVFVNRKGEVVIEKGMLDVKRGEGNFVIAKVDGEFLTDADVKMEAYKIYELLLKGVEV